MPTVSVSLHLPPTLLAIGVAILALGPGAAFVRQIDGLRRRWRADAPEQPLDIAGPARDL